MFFLFFIVSDLPLQCCMVFMGNYSLELAFHDYHTSKHVNLDEEWGKDILSMLLNSINIYYLFI